MRYTTFGWTPPPANPIIPMKILTWELHGICSFFRYGSYHRHSSLLAHFFVHNLGFAIFVVMPFLPAHLSILPLFTHCPSFAHLQYLFSMSDKGQLYTVGAGTGQPEALYHPFSTCIVSLAIVAHHYSVWCFPPSPQKWQTSSCGVVLHIDPIICMLLYIIGSTSHF